MPNNNLLNSVENSIFIFDNNCKNKKIYISNKVIKPISSNVLYNTLWRLHAECTKQFITIICRGLIWPDCNEQITNFKRKLCRCPQFFKFYFFGIQALNITLEAAGVWRSKEVISISLLFTISID